MDETSVVSKTGATSRRAILAATAGGLGAWVAAALGRVAPAAAIDGETVNVGDNLAGTKTTIFNVSSADTAALWGYASGGGTSVGIRGDTVSSAAGSAGVLGIGQAVGVRGGGPTGVRGEGTGYGVDAYSAGGTAVHGNSPNGNGLFAESQTGYGSLGYSRDRTAIYGWNDAPNHPAVVGEAAGGSTGVCGVVGDFSSLVPKPMTGVHGDGTQGGASGRGVYGVAGSGQGVRGETTSGAALYGTASVAAGYAIRGSGRVRFDKVSGVATIAANATSVTVTPGVDVTADSFVLLTAKANIGTRSLYFTTDTANNTITVRISSSRTSSTSIGWLLLR